MRVVMIMRSQAGVPGRSGVPGGQIGMVQLARALVRAGIRVELFVGGPRMSYLLGLDDVPTTYFHWPLWLDRWLARAPAPLRALGARVRRWRWLRAVAALPGIDSADVVHAQGLEDAEALLGCVVGPLVVTHWGRAGRWLPDAAASAPDSALASRLEALRRDVKLVAIGDAQRDVLVAAQLPPVAVIAPGIDLACFRPGSREAARRRLGLPADTDIVLYVGRLSTDKNVETLLEAFAQLPPRARRAQLLIVGDGPLRPQLQQRIAELKLDAATTLLPFVAHHELPAYYWAANVAVVPSNLLETFCMVALEAIACRCPLIVSDQLPEILHRFPQIPSVAPYDVAGFVHWIDAARAGRVSPADASAVAEYAWSEVALRYLEVYRMAQRNPRGPAAARRIPVLQTAVGETDVQQRSA